MICVLLQKGIGGEVLELANVDPQISVHELKQTIWSLCHVPSRCQKLLIGTRILHDSERLIEHCCLDAMDLSIGMLISLDQVCQDVSSSDMHIKVEGLRALAALRCPCDEHVIKTVCQCLESHCGHVRQFGQIQGHLEDHAGHVRQLAVEALGSIAGRGHVDVIAAVSARLEDRDCSVRKAAVQTLTSLAEQGCEHMIAIIIPRLEHQDYYVRLAGLEALSKMATKNDRRAIDSVIARLTDRDAFVRQAAVEILASIADIHDDHDIVAALKGRLKDNDRSVRQAAVEVLKQFTGDRLRQ